MRKKTSPDHSKRHRIVRKPAVLPLSYIRKEKAQLRTAAFYDQPNGKCAGCKWNDAVDQLKDGAVSCACPTAHLTNDKCILKVQMLLLNEMLGKDDSGTV